MQNEREGRFHRSYGPGSGGLVAAGAVEPNIAHLRWGEVFEQAGDAYRFLKNVAGFWLLEQCATEWGRKALDLLDLAAGAPSDTRRFDVTDERFLSPPHMADEIRAAIGTEDAPRAVIARSIVESVAAAVAGVVEELRATDPVEELVIVGGGAASSFVRERIAAHAVSASSLVPPRQPLSATPSCRASRSTGFAPSTTPEPGPQPPRGMGDERVGRPGLPDPCALVTSESQCVRWRRDVLEGGQIAGSRTCQIRVRSP